MTNCFLPQDDLVCQPVRRVVPAAAQALIKAEAVAAAKRVGGTAAVWITAEDNYRAAAYTTSWRLRTAGLT